MGFYKNESDDAFFPAIYITEDKVLERQTQALRDQGWAIIEIHCKNILASQDPQAGALEIIRAVNLPHKLPDDNYMSWTQEIISDLDWLDLSKGVSSSSKTTMYSSPPGTVPTTLKQNGWHDTYKP